MSGTEETTSNNGQPQLTHVGKDLGDLGNFKGLIHNETKPLDYSKITIGVPTSLSNESDVGYKQDLEDVNTKIVKNTRVTLTAKPDNGKYVDSSTLQVEYRRIDLDIQAKLLFGMEKTLKYSRDYFGSDREFNATNLEEYFKTKFEYVEDSIQEATFNVSGETATVTLLAKPGSYVYTGTCTVSVKPEESGSQQPPETEAKPLDEGVILSDGFSYFIPPKTNGHVGSAEDEENHSDL